MKNKVRLAVAAATLAVLTAAGAGTAAYAHHAFAAEFDAAQPIELKGTITKANLTVTAASDSKAYDGTTTSAGAASASGNASSKGCKCKLKQGLCLLMRP